MNKLSRLDLANKAFFRKDYDMAYELFATMPEPIIVDPDIWLNLGWMFQAGSGVDKDMDKATLCYKKAAATNTPLSNYYLGTIYRSNNDMKEALTHFSIEVKNNHPASLYWLGSMYLLGEGCKKDISKAEKYLKSAAKAGHVYAKRDMAVAKINGTFGKKNVITGLFQYVVAVTQGIGLVFKNSDDHKLG